MRLLLHAKDLTENRRVKAGGNYGAFQSALGALPESATAHIPKTKEGKANAYTLFLAAQRSGKFTTASLRKSLEACLEANRRLVTTSLDHQLVLHQLVARILTS